ncbi:MAG: InlB B-repeat-containing protein, partial [Raoultibacter sp.]
HYIGSTYTAYTNANTYTKEGHTFAGWAMSATGSVQYTDGAQVTSLVASGETTLYAKWTPNDYNVIFNLDGGTGVTSPIKASYGSKLTKPSPDPTKQGYTFNNWYKNEAKTVLWNFATDTVGLTTTIYAKFTANTYSVRFDSNGGTGTVMQDQTFTYDTPAKALSQNTYTKQGYLFAGWSKTKGGAKDYADTEKVRNLALSGTLTLYAVWTPITYSVHFNSSEGEGSMDTQTGFTYDTPKALSPNRFSKKGHTFTGWATTASDPFVYKDQESVSTLATEQGQTVELYACWSKNTYLVTFESNNGSEVSPQDVLFGEVISKPTDPTRPGYTFVGWYRNKSLTLAWNFTTDTVQNETVLYAKWTAVIDIDVPLDPKISIDAQGTVITDEQALRPFISRSPQDVLVTSVSCSSTDTTQDIFPNASQWSNVKVTLTPNGSPADLVEVKINQSNFQPSLIIPAGTPITPAKLPISFGLILPQGIALAYSDQAEGVSVANLSYTFELLS